MDESSPSLSRSIPDPAGGDSSMSLSALGCTENTTGVSGLEDLTDFSQGTVDFHKPEKGKKKGLEGAFQRKQLLHDLQLLRIELSQKSLIIDNLKAQHMSKTDELEEKLHEALHKKQILQARLESAMAIQQDDAKKRQEQTQKELKIILDRQRELEQTNRRLQSKASNIRSQLRRDFKISENEYVQLKAQSEDDMTIADYFAVRLYEALQPLTIERDNLRSQRDKLSADLAQITHNLHSYEQEIMKERRHRSNTEVQLQGATTDLEQARKALDERIGKAQRFDSVMDERNRLDKEHSNLIKENSFLKAEQQSFSKELLELRNEKDQRQQTLQLLKQDKEYLTRNLSECTVKLENAEDSLQRTQGQLERAKTSREELYERYAASRDEARVVYERRLQTELDRIRLQTESELEKLRGDSKETYERENRGLREARDLALLERDQLSKLRDDAEKRCEIFSAELRALESTVDARVSDFQNEAQMKTFELDRLQLVHDETCKTLDRVQNENERLSKKLELVTTDYGELQRKSSTAEAGLKANVQDLRTRLSAYEKLEQEMDDVVMQAAEVEIGDGTNNPSDAERVLFSYGYGANIPTTAKRRMKQSVHLARRVLQLEKINTTLHADIQRREEEMQQMGDKLANTNKLLDETRQPYSYLIESMRKRDEELEAQRSHVRDVADKLDALKNENKELRETKRLMSMDLERLLNHRQEMALMKRVVANMTSPRENDLDKNFLASLESRHRSTPAPFQDPEPLKMKGARREKFDGSFFPSPVIFTKQEKSKVNPERYRKLRELTKNL
ncbi:progesterone-induced-blocking factor 1-like [Clavelina lepadiformis]|uniref:progesterone-induced-blocking factor 1-like n=1 Tax=Clavelina lepadiformis TaxID=159417 RepID=UPI0040436EF2